MGIIKTKIVGLSPLLMHSPSAMINVDEEDKQSKVTSMSKKGINAEEEAEAGAYRMKSGNLYIPSSAIKGAMINASSFKKLGGRLALKPFIAGGVVVTPEEVDLGVKKYDIDKRSVVIRATKGRVIRYRPRLDKWEAEFELRYNDEMFPTDAHIGNIKTVLIEAGTRIGILDFRPAKGGSFGMFKITKFEVEVKKGD